MEKFQWTKANKQTLWRRTYLAYSTIGIGPVCGGLLFSRYLWKDVVSWASVIWASVSWASVVVIPKVVCINLSSGSTLVAKTHRTVSHPPGQNQVHIWTDNAAYINARETPGKSGGRRDKQTETVDDDSQFYI